MTTTDVHKNYEAFLEKRNTLVSLIDRQIFLMSSLSIDTEVDSLQKIRERVSTDVFKVLIVGEFKRGKSTFINAMLGQDILPAYATPCTAVINEVKWGESSRALVHYSMTKDGTKAQVETIPVEAIEEYVVIPENPPEDYVNPYEKVEIFYPLDLCKSGVEIIDSPGLNEHLARTQVTESYLNVVDAIIFVFTCEALASQSEVQFIEKNLIPLGHDDLFFVCNRFDQIRKDSEKERVKKFALSKLTPLTKRGENGIFFISAFNALEGRLDQDEERVNKSGIPLLEKELEKFLIADRGRLKILEPAKDIQESIAKAQRSIPEREALLKITQGELEKRYVEAQGTFNALETRRKQIETRITQFLDDTSIRVYDESFHFFKSLPSNVDKWINEYEITSEINFFALIKNPLKLKESAETQLKPIIKELSDCIYLSVEGEFINWKKKNLDDFLISRVESLKQDIDARASEFIREADYLRSELSASSDGYTEQALNHLGVVGKAFGFSLFGNSVIAGGVLGVFATVFAAPLMFMVIPMVIRVVSSSKDDAKIKIKDTIKEIVIKEFSSILEKTAKGQADRVSRQVYKQLEGIRETVDQGLTKEIQSIKDQVESVLKEKKKGEASVAQKVRELAEISQRLRALEGELDDLINQLTLL